MSKFDLDAELEGLFDLDAELDTPENPFSQVMVSALPERQSPLPKFERLWRRRNPNGAHLRSLSQQAQKEIFDWTPDLHWYDLIIINTSAGKDSLVSMDVIDRMARRAKVRDRVWVVHCDLGRVEHPGTKELAAQHAEVMGLPFYIAYSQSKGDLLEGIETRLEKYKHDPVKGWPGKFARFCTSGWKTAEVSKLITAWISNLEAPDGNPLGGRSAERHLGRPLRILNILGLRVDEGTDRGKRPTMQMKGKANSRRVIHEWLPVHGWPDEKVFKQMAKSKMSAHPWYAKGGKRLSCIICPLAANEDIVLGTMHYPKLAAEYVALQRKYDKPLKSTKEYGGRIEEMVKEGKRRARSKGKKK